MKKIFSYLIATILTLSILLTGCGYETMNDAYASKNTEATTPSETVSDNPLIATELQRDYVYNGSKTEVIGQYAYIYIDKSTLQEVTMDEYAEFCETVVDHSIYHWVSIICDDGTGIVFEGSQYAYAVYGTVNYEGIIIQENGVIWQTEAGFEYEASEEDVLQIPELTTYPYNVDSTYADLAQDLPDHIYNTYGSENGLGGTIYKFTGTAEDYYTLNADGFVFDQLIVDTEDGTVLIVNQYKTAYNSTMLEIGAEYTKAIYPYNIDDFTFPNVGETANFFCVYMGYSETEELPVFALGANPAIFQILEFDDPAI